MSELGELLRSLRGKRSLREASKITGISHNYLSIVEQGVDPRSGSPVSPTPDTLKKLSESYNYSYERLMELAGYTYPKEDAVDRLIQYLELELTNEEIKQRLDFKVDEIVLSNEDIDEFIAFVRAKRSMKKKHSASFSKNEDS